MAVDDPYSTVADSAHALERSDASNEDSEHYVDKEDLVRWVGKAKAHSFLSFWRSEVG